MRAKWAISVGVGLLAVVIGLDPGDVGGAPQSDVSGLLAGRVVDGDSKTPVADAVVRLTTGSAPVGGSGGQPAQGFDDSVLTDRSGRFLFSKLAAGSYQLTVTKAGCIDGGFGKTRPTGNPVNIVLSPNERRIDVSLNLWRLAGLSGVVADEHGDPVVGVLLQVLEQSALAGRDVFVLRSTVATDDRGEFAAWDLRPGRYVLAVPSVSVTVPSNFHPQQLTGALSAALGRQIPGLAAIVGPPDSFRTERVGDFTVQVVGRGPVPPPLAEQRSYETTFYPAARSASTGELVTLRSGETRAGIQIRLSPSPVVRLGGTVSDADGPVADVVVRLLPPSTDELMSDLGFETAVSITDKNGRFLFVGVPEGRYTVRVAHKIGRAGPPAPGETKPATITTLRWIQQGVSVGAAPGAPLDLRLRAGLGVSGTVRFAQSDPVSIRTAMANVSLVLEPADGRPRDLPAIRPLPDGRFELGAVEPGKYFLRARATPAGWSLLRAEYEGRDISDDAVVIDQSDVDAVTVTFTNRPSELSGTVYGPARTADASATVAVFAADPRYWSEFGWAPRRLRTVRTDAGGRFEILGLPAGRYRIAAYPDASGNDWDSLTDMLRSLVKVAETVEVKDADRTSVNLVTAIGSGR